MQKLLINLPLWEALVIYWILVVAGVLLVFALRNTNDSFPNRRRTSWFSLLSVLLVFAVLAVSETKAKHQIIHELSQFTTPYPGAAPVVSAKGSSQGFWIFETEDNPDKIRDFYLGLAHRQKIPFQDIRNDQFYFGEGTNAVSVTTSEYARVTRIFYGLVNSGPSDPD